MELLLQFCKPVNRRLFASPEKPDFRWRDLATKATASGARQKVLGLCESFQKALDPKKILAPGGRLVGGDPPAYFSRYPISVSKHAYGCEPSRCVRRVAIDCKLTGDLAMRRKIGRDDRRTDGQCFDDGQSEPLGERGHQQSPGMRDEPT